MRHVRSLLLVVVTALPCAANEETDNGWTPLFDSKTLKGWEGSKEMFRIEDGAIVAGTLKRDIPHNDFLCTEREYGDFELRLSVKLLGEGDNAGIQIRSRRVPDHHEVSGYQADVGAAFGGSVWGGLYDESRRNRMLVQPDQKLLEEIVKKDGWNEMQIRCEGPRIQIWMGGKQTADYTEEDADIPRKGIIGLQIHGGPPAEAWYKDIQIRELK